jgi:ATP-dependent DNA helicase RecG
VFVMGTPGEDAISIVKALAASGESYYVEFKSGWTYGPDGRAERDVREIAGDIGKTLVAFANSDGGDLLVGVEDDGEIAGVPHGQEHVAYLRAWPQQLADGGDGFAVRVFDVEADGRRVLLFRVGACDGFTATTSEGRCLLRKKDASVPVSTREVEGRRAHALGDSDFEAQPVPAATVEDLDWELIDHGRQRDGLGVPLGGFDRVGLLRYWNLVDQQRHRRAASRGVALVREGGAALAS